MSIEDNDPTYNPIFTERPVTGTIKVIKEESTVVEIGKFKLVTVTYNVVIQAPKEDKPSK